MFSSSGQGIYNPSGGRNPGAECRWCDHLDVLVLTGLSQTISSFFLHVFSLYFFFTFVLLSLLTIILPITICPYILAQLSCFHRANAAPSLCRCGTTFCVGSAVTCGQCFQLMWPKMFLAKCYLRLCSCWCSDMPGPVLRTRDICRSGIKSSLTLNVHPIKMLHNMELYTLMYLNMSICCEQALFLPSILSSYVLTSALC